MEQPFYEGQKIVALTNSDNWRKGDEFIAGKVWKLCCSWMVDVGIVFPYTTTCRCRKCGFSQPGSKGTTWPAAAYNFAPIQSARVSAIPELLKAAVEETLDVMRVTEKSS